MTAANLPKPIANTHAVSLREQSTSDLTRAIHSPADHAYTLERTRICLSCFYEADMVPADRAAMIEEFGKALRSFPKWAVVGAFDDWMATARRRPAPGDIVALASKRVQRLTTEIAERKKAEPEPVRELPSVEERRRIAAEVMAGYGSAKRFPGVGEGTA